MVGCDLATSCCALSSFLGSKCCCFVATSRCISSRDYALKSQKKFFSEPNHTITTAMLKSKVSTYLPQFAFAFSYVQI